MKILSKMLSRRTQSSEPKEAGLERDMGVEPARKRPDPVADDSGEVNATRRPPADAAPLARRDEEPEVAGSGWNDDDWSDDEDWDDDEDWGDDAGFEPAEERASSRAESRDRKLLVSEIRDAMASASRRPSKPSMPRRVIHSQPGGQVHSRDWSEDDEFGRRAKARDALGASDENEDRLLEKTETQMEDRETSRRRSAMAHLKAAAAATKADRVLRHVVSRDPSADPEEQSPYRDDLAKVVRPHNTSRPISRKVTPSAPRDAVWDRGEGDEDAALFAASNEAPRRSRPDVEAELARAEAERLARTPSDLSAEDFDSDGAFGSASDIGEAFPASPFARADVRDDRSAFAEDGFEDEFEDDLEASDEMPAAFGAEDRFASDADTFAYDDDEEDDFAPRPSTVVSETIAAALAPDTAPEPEEADVRRKIWEMADEVAQEVEKARGAPKEPEGFVDVAAAVAGRAGATAGRGAGRVKTRLLGFQVEEAKDVFAQGGAAASPVAQFPAGWIVVTDGPGRGACFTLQGGVSQIGRGDDQAVRLDFGDTSISRNNHAAVAYDPEERKFYLGHGGKSNLVRLNGRPVLSTEELNMGDTIRIGETTLKFVALCGADFTWGEGDDR